jgi:hypothetical protein
MARKHVFFIVVLLAAAALAGFAAVSRTAAVTQPEPAAASAVSEGELAARLRALDRFEAKLRKQLRAAPSARAAVPAAVVTRAAPAPVQAYDDDHEAEDEHEHEDDDD